MSIVVDIGPTGRRLLRMRSGGMTLLESEHAYLQSIFGDLLADAKIDIEGGRPVRVTYSLDRNGYALLTPETPILGPNSHVSIEERNLLEAALERCRVFRQQDPDLVANPDVQDVLQSFMLPDREDSFAYRTYRDPLTRRTRLVILWGTIPATADDDIQAINTVEREDHILSGLIGLGDRLFEWPWIKHASWAAAALLCLLLVALFFSWLDDGDVGDVAAVGRERDTIARQDPAEQEGTGAVDPAVADVQTNVVVTDVEDVSLLDRVVRWVWLPEDDVGRVVSSDAGPFVVVNDDPLVDVVGDSGSGADSIGAEPDDGADLAPSAQEGAELLDEDSDEGFEEEFVDEAGLDGDAPGSLPAGNDGGEAAPAAGEFVYVRLEPEGAVRVHLDEPVSFDYLDRNRVDDDIRRQIALPQSPRPGAELRTIWVPMSQGLLDEVSPEALAQRSVPTRRSEMPASESNAVFYKLTIDDQGHLISKDLVSVRNWDR